jgi:hypothetical protein
MRTLIYDGERIRLERERGSAGTLPPDVSEMRDRFDLSTAETLDLQRFYARCNADIEAWKHRSKRRQEGFKRG